MRSVIIIVVFLVGVIAIIAQEADESKSNNDSFFIGRVQLDSEEQAILRALQFTGLERRFTDRAAATAALPIKDSISDDVTPFLSDKINNKSLWRVKFTDVDFRRPLLLKNKGVSNLRDIEILLDQETGQLLRIIVSSGEIDPTLPPEPSAEYAEKMLRQTGEIYHGFPETIPQVPFIEAVFSGVGCRPWSANEIIAQLVIHSRFDEEPKPVWCFTCRGLPVAKEHSKGTLRQLNRERCVVDATTGQWLFMTNRPLLESEKEPNGGGGSGSMDVLIPD